MALANLRRACRRRPALRGSATLKSWLVFLIFNVAWALAGSAVLRTNTVNPLVLSAFWLVGYVWGAAYLAGGIRLADHLVKVWLGFLAGVFALAFLVAIVS